MHLLFKSLFLVAPTPNWGLRLSTMRVLPNWSMGITHPYAYNLKRMKEAYLKKTLVGGPSSCTQTQAGLKAIHLAHRRLFPDMSMEITHSCTNQNGRGMHLLKENLFLVAPPPVWGLKAIHLEHRRLIRLLSILWLALCRIK